MKYVEWANSHLEVIYLVATAVITLLFKPGSKIEYDQLPPRIAAILRLVGALGIDVPNVLKALRALFGSNTPPATPGAPTPPESPGAGSGSEPPTKPDSPSAFRTRGLRFAAFAAILVLLCAGCPPASPAQSPERATVRAALLTVAEALKLADTACADIARATEKKEVASACRKAYDVARPSLLAAESGVDTWSAASQDQVLCAVGNAARALRSIGDVVTKAGGHVPPALDDALKLTVTFGGCDAGTQ